MLFQLDYQIHVYNSANKCVFICYRERKNERKKDQQINVILDMIHKPSQVCSLILFSNKCVLFCHRERKNERKVPEVQTLVQILAEKDT